MAILLGLDTGGTYTDAVLLDDATDQVIASAKALTSRPDLSIGIAGAVDAVLARGDIAAEDVALVSLSTTLATNALVEGQGGRVALIFVGFGPDDLDRAGLAEALAGDPVITLAGGHSYAGAELAPLDLEALQRDLSTVGEVTGFAVAAQFATRNPAHEIAVRDLIRQQTGRPVTCSHELSSALGGPKRALTAVLNARLIGMIDGLIAACELDLTRRGITAPLMVVRGDGALISAAVARDKPIETILSGPAASVAGAAWLTGQSDALVSDIGGTTTDVCLLRDGRPLIDPDGARVGPFRTMVEAVAMRTTGLGGDSEVHLVEGLDGGLQLGPRRVMPVSLLASQAPELVHPALDRASARDRPAEADGCFVVPLWAERPEGLDRREAAVVERLETGALPMSEVVLSRTEAPALARLVARGAVIVAGVTPSDASHALGWAAAWDTEAAEKALALMARRRTGSGELVAMDGKALAQAIVAQLTDQTATCLIEAGFAEDDAWEGIAPQDLACHPFVRAALGGHSGVLQASLTLGVPVVGLGASAGTYYPAVGSRLGCEMILPQYAGVANAVGAVVGQVRITQRGLVSAAGEGVFIAHLVDGPQRYSDQSEAIDSLRAALEARARGQATEAGMAAMRLSHSVETREAQIEGRPLFVEAEVTVVAEGRPQIAGTGYTG